MSTAEAAARRSITPGPSVLDTDPLSASTPTAPLVEAPTLPGTARSAMAIAGTLALAVGAVALVVAVGFAGAARGWLRFPFTGVPARPAEAEAIFLHNLRALTAIGSLLLIAQSPHWAASKAAPGGLQKSLQRLGEVLLGAAVAANVVIVGASIGAYGVPMVRAALPQGPVELAAYALALALYREGRARRLPARHTLVVAGLSVSALVLAALLETFVNL